LNLSFRLEWFDFCLRLLIQGIGILVISLRRLLPVKREPMGRFFRFPVVVHGACWV